MEEFLRYARSLEFTHCPDYNHFRTLFFRKIFEQTVSWQKVAEDNLLVKEVRSLTFSEKSVMEDIIVSMYKHLDSHCQVPFEVEKSKGDVLDSLLVRKKVKQ